MKHVPLCAAMLLCVLVSGSVISCGEVPVSENAVSDDTTVTETAAETEENYIATLPEKDYGGSVVTMVTVDNYNDHFKLNVESDGETLNDAGYQRNLAVSELLNVTFAVEETASPAQNFKKSVMAGDTDYDLIFPHCTDGVSTLVTEKVLYDLNTLPYLDLSNPWWNQQMTGSLGIGGKLFYCSGDIVMTWQGMNAILFNKSYLSGMDLEKDLYQTVFDGEWTLDYMTGLIKGISADLDGDGAMTAADQYGLLDNSGVGYGYMYAADQRITEQDSEGYPVLTLNTERMASIVEKYYNLIYSGDTYVDSYYSVTYPTSTYRSMLIEGRSFLTNLDIGGLYPYLREIEFDFGILPVPKYDESQDDYRVFCGAGLIGVPSNAADPEKTGILLEAMGYYSYEYIRPAFFDIVLENKSVRDENSYKVIQLMHENKVFDFGFNFDSTGVAYGLIRTVVIDNHSTDFASVYAKNEAKIEKGFQKIVDACKEE